MFVPFRWKIISHIFVNIITISHTTVVGIIAILSHAIFLNVIIMSHDRRGYHCNNETYVFVDITATSHTTFMDISMIISRRIIVNLIMMSYICAYRYYHSYDICGYHCGNYNWLPQLSLYDSYFYTYCTFIYFKCLLIFNLINRII
jgi:hypothetical protein